MKTLLSCAAMALALLAVPVQAAETGLKEGTPDLKEAGPLAFGPDGVLLIGDPQSAAIFAIDTKDARSSRKAAKVELKGVNEKIAAMLGVPSGQLLINDLAVNPVSKNVYLSVSRGQGPGSQPVILKIDAAGKISEVSLEKVPFAKAVLPNAPPLPDPESAQPKQAGERQKQRGGQQNQRRESITDLAYVDGQVFVAGLSNEEFASKLRSIPFPFSKADEGTSVEIYHGAHGKFETRSPVRTFAPFEINGEPHLLAAYTCTPLVKFPVSDLKAGQKIKGTTIAELGNRNRPLDMVVYEKDGKSYILIANNSRGVMKVSTDNVDKVEGITKPVNGTAGLSYETIAEMKGVVQLDRLDDQHAVVLIQEESGAMSLKTVELP